VEYKASFDFTRTHYSSCNPEQQILILGLHVAKTVSCTTHGQKVSIKSCLNLKMSECDIPDWLEDAKTRLDFSEELEESQPELFKKFESSIVKVETALYEMKSIVSSLKKEYIRSSQKKHVSMIEANARMRSSKR